MAQLEPGLQGGFAGLARQAGLRYRLPTDGDPRLSAGGSYPPFFRLVPLQDADGEFYPDAQERLLTEGGSLGLGEAIAEHAKVSGVDVSLWGDHELRIVSEPDTIAALRQVQASSDAKLLFFRLRSTDALMARLFLWNIVAELAQGIPGQKVLANLRTAEDRLVGGIVQMAPSGFVCFPLLARSQPLAVVFLTAHGSQVVVVPARGTFLRPIEFTTWPVGLSRVRFGGPGRGVYRSSVRAFPDGHAEVLLRFLLKRADAAMHRLTAPELFATPEGRLDLDAHWLLWSSVLFGMDAITSLASEWNQASAIWTAFRALSTLQGIWQGHRPKAPPLSAILDPHHLQSYAASKFLAGPERVWASDIVNNYEQDLRERFPDTPLDMTLRQVGEVRNLVHGVYATGDPTRRLKVLRRIEKHSPNLQLINEVAVFWWTSVLLDMASNARPGGAPWE